MQKEESNDKEKNQNTKSIFVLVKMKIERKPELEDDYQLFRMKWQREIRTALATAGDVRYLTIVT